MFLVLEEIGVGIILVRVQIDLVYQKASPQPRIPSELFFFIKI